MRKKIITIVIIALAALILGGGYLLYQRYYGGAVKFDIQTAPAVGYEHRQTASSHGIVSNYLWMRTKNLMLGQDGDSLFIPSSYMIEGRLSYQDAESSGEYRLADQALLLDMYVRSGDRLSAMRLKEQILNYYDFAAESNAGVSAFLTAYLDYYISYGSVNDGDKIQELVDVLFDEEGSMRTESLSVAVYEQGSFYSLDEPGDGSYSSLEQIGEDAPAEYTDVTGIEISSIDLRLIRNLENNGLLPEGSYERNLELVLGSQVSSSVPLFAYAYADGIYIYSHNVAAAVDVESAVVTMRHLAQVGELPDDAYNWLKMQIINSGVIRQQYYYSYGTTEGAEAVNIYPDIMHIALELGDDDLYDRACTLEGSRVATYTSSPALSMIYREEDGRFVFYARENLDVCLAVT
ncbi:MAG: hypothetical protein IJR15_03715 [Clostridiales bacterium]|nr:hypothetical protein [Clostridiales bacterium]